MLFNPIPRQKPYCTFRDFLIFIKMFLAGKLTKGPFISQFESEFSKNYGVAHALTVGSCRSGFALVLDALGIKAEDEIILPAFNLCAFPKILKFKGIRPVFVDIDEKTFNIDANKIEESITPKTKAIVAVHLFGNVCDMDQIMAIAQRHNLYVIEDCANAYMTKYKNRNVGTYGDVACFSLGHSKDIPTFGGGVIATDNRNLYARIEEERDKGYRFPNVGDMVKIFIKSFILKIATLKIIFLIFVYPLMRLCTTFGFDIVGRFVSDDDCMIASIPRKRFTNVQARIGLDKLKENNVMQVKRIDIAQKFNNALSSLKGITAAETIEEGNHAYWNYPLLSNQRRFLINRLLRHGIDARGLTEYHCNRFKIFEEFKRDCPVADQVAPTILTLPIYHSLTEKEVCFVGRVMDAVIPELT